MYGSEAWCVRENDMAILRKPEGAMIRAMCGVKLLDRRNSEELMDIKESLDRMAEQVVPVRGGTVMFEET